MKLAGAGETNVFVNMQLFIFAGVVFLLVLAIILTLSLVPALRVELRKLVVAQISGFIFNGLI